MYPSSFAHLWTIILDGNLKVPISVLLFIQVPYRLLDVDQVGSPEHSSLICRKAISTRHHMQEVQSQAYHGCFGEQGPLYLSCQMSELDSAKDTCQ